MAEVLVLDMLEELASINQQVNEEKKQILKKLTDNFELILEVLDKGESGLQVGKENTAVRDWLEKLKETCYGIHDKLVELETLIDKASKPMRKVFSLTPCYRIFSKQDMLRDFAAKIGELNAKLDSMGEKPDFSLTNGTIEPERPHTIPTSAVSKVHGRTQDIESLVNELLKESQKQLASISVISIVGMTGIGKTTLALAVFNDDRVKNHFDIAKWVCASEPFDKNKMVEEIRESLTPKSDELPESNQKSEYPVGKKFLIILDDVWNYREWKQLKDSLESFFNEGSSKSGFNKGIILVTTRKKDVALEIGTTSTNMILLETLSQEESWSLFRQLAISEGKSEENKKFEKIGKKIANKCKGFPLAISTLGNHLLLKKIEDWENVADSEMWELKVVQEKIFPSLLSSYFDLPFKLRKIFSYCAIFPKDYDMDKNILIDLWMSGCYNRKEQTEDEEFNSDECIEKLAKSSFLKNFTKNEFDGSIESFKLYDIMHDFAQFLSKHEWFTEDIDDFEVSRVKFSCEKTQHLVLGLRRGELFPMQISGGEKIRSLVVRCERYMNSMTLSKLLGDFPRLRRLDLSNCDLSVEKLPREIKKLIYLEYLDLSGNVWLKELPEAICELHNLKTLNLNGCVALKKLPRGIGKLRNLRHLLNCCTYRSLSHLPKGIENLANLQTLKEFVVSRDRQGIKGGLKCLEKLKNLQGSLDILKLKNVARKSDQVQRANLENMEKLLSLRLDFGWEDEDSRLRGTEIDEIVKISEVLEAPPSNLKTLGIYSYQGKTSSFNWTSLKKLRALTLDNCTNWKNLPSLGGLFSLESLHISWMDSVEKVGDEFLETAEPEIIAFENLKTLAFSQMAKWEDWIVARSVMPSLESLSISFCNQLQLLPDYILQIETLKKLEIKECGVLQNLYKKQTGREWSKISHIPHVEV